ncbi:MAG: hypothetical protein AB1411_09135 [Nitrospirota bacterium]
MPYPVGTGIAFAGSDAFSVEPLPKDPKEFRRQVDQIVGKADSLIGKLKANPKAAAAVLDLVQTRDNILREVVKVEGTPDGSKWTFNEMRDSVGAMLKLLKDQYDKASSLGG